MMEHYAPHFYPPEDFDLFVDAFFGAGAISIWIAEQFPHVKFLVNDYNSELILLYRQLADNGEAFIRRALEVEKKLLSYELDADQRAYYNELKYRHIDQLDDPVNEAAQLYVMLRINFNGFWKIYEYSKGRYASHPGEIAQRNIVNMRDLKKWSQLLSTRCTILNEDFGEIQNHLTDRSYVYFDPPYRESTNIYTDDGFSEEDQIRLCALSEQLCKDGHYVAYSNKEIGDGFFDKHLPSFEHHFFDVHYGAGRGTSYNASNEILAVNFQSIPPNSLETFFV